MDAVKNTIPAIAEAIEAVRQKMIIFRYQLLHIGAGKKHFTDLLQVIQPDIKRYEIIVKQLKTQIRERWVLLEEKKTMPVLQVFQHQELAQKIAGLMENIEGLKSEKALLLNHFNCADDHGMSVVKQRVASMESSLKTLNQQEDKYTAELDAALAQYAELQRQAADMDTVELDTARQTIRHGKEREMAQHLQATYQKKFDSRLLTQSRKDVAGLLGEVAESVSIRQKLQQLKQKEHRHGSTMRQSGKKAPPGSDAQFLLRYHPYDRPTPTPSGFCRGPDSRTADGFGLPTSIWWHIVCGQGIL